MQTYTGCPVGNVPDFGKIFRKLKYIDITQKHLYPKLNGYRDNSERKVWSSCGSTYCTCFAWWVGDGYFGARNNTTQQSEHTPDKELELKSITGYVSGYTENDTTGMLSPPNVWSFNVAPDMNSDVFDFYFLIWSLSWLLCCVVSGSVLQSTTRSSAFTLRVVTVTVNCEEL